MAKLHGNGRGANLSHQCTPFKTIQMTSMEKTVTSPQMRILLRTIHQKSSKSVLSRPSTKCAKNGPKSGSFKTIESQNMNKKGSFKTIENGSKNDTSFKTMGEKGQKSTSFKTIANRVKNLNPQYMVPVDEVS